MIVTGDNVKYIGKNRSERSSSRGKVVSEPYQIQQWTYVNVVFGAESDWHPINVENLEVEGLTSRFDMID